MRKFFVYTVLILALSMFVLSLRARCGDIKLPLKIFDLLQRFRGASVLAFVTLAWLALKILLSCFFTLFLV